MESDLAISGAPGQRKKRKRKRQQRPDSRPSSSTPTNGGLRARFPEKTHFTRKFGSKCCIARSWTSSSSHMGSVGASPPANSKCQKCASSSAGRRSCEAMVDKSPSLPPGRGRWPTAPSRAKVRSSLKASGNKSMKVTQKDAFSRCDVQMEFFTLVGACF